jgi:hypothetical protein
VAIQQGTLVGKNLVRMKKGKSLKDDLVEVVRENNASQEPDPEASMMLPSGGARNQGNGD